MREIDRNKGVGLAVSITTIVNQKFSTLYEM